MTFSRTRCAHCKEKFVPERQGQIVHMECIEPWTLAQAAKRERQERKEALAKAKITKADTKRRKEAIKTIPDRIKEAQSAFNAYIRLRDREKPCICCGRPLGESTVGGDYDCGHYRSTGSASHLRFNEDNAHAQRKVCNRYGSGRAVDYRVGLIARIGLDRVESLEANNTQHKWTHDELIQIRDTYRGKLKALNAD